jgi:tetratricopeptide (TPR) repeat protein
MDEFAAVAATLPNPRLAALKGFSHLDKAEEAQWDPPNLELALSEINEALTTGDFWSFYEERAAIYTRQSKHDLALADLNKALELRGPIAELLFYRSSSYVALKRFEDAAQDILAGIRIDPTPSGQRVPIYETTRGLLAQAKGLRDNANFDQALRLLDLASAINPGEREIDNLRVPILQASAQQAVAAGGEQSLEERAKASPHDFELHRQLDALWSQTAQWERIASMWTEFIANNPNEGRAYNERGGAYSHMRKISEAYSDAKKACELGVSEACAWAEVLRSHLQ